MTQEDALDVLKLGYNVFLTGSAGSGKTHVLKAYIAYLKEHDIPIGITASTGIAATHLDGITLNSWAGIGIRQSLSETELFELLQRKYLRERIVKTKVLVIDEISMLSASTLDMVNALCKACKRDPRVFGNMQLVLCGDFFQLPPITRDMPRNRHTLPFVYKSNSWQELDLRVCYLEKEYRQDDKRFSKVLSEIRSNTVSKDSIKMLAGRLYKPLDHVSTRLYTHNVDVDAINLKELTKLDGHIHTYTMEEKGNELLLQIMKKSCLAPFTLQLKKGAVVMFVKNNFDKGYVNGTLGTVIDFDKKGFPIIQTTHGNTLTATPTQWAIEEEGINKASIKQLPLRLAWAITIHKSQGMTLDAAEIDLGKAFVPGMGYVALSRVKRLTGLRLMGLNHKAFQVHTDVLSFDKALKEQSQKTQKELEELVWIEKEVTERLFLREMKKEEQKREPSYRNH